MKVKHPNRSNKHIDKKSSGCAMCKPHKHGWDKHFKEKERQVRNEITKRSDD